MVEVSERALISFSGESFRTSYVMDAESRDFVRIREIASFTSPRKLGKNVLILMDSERASPAMGGDQAAFPRRLITRRLVSPSAAAPPQLLSRTLLPGRSGCRSPRRIC